MTTLLIFLGTCIGFACTTVTVFACASHKKENEKGKQSQLPRKKDCENIEDPPTHLDDVHIEVKPDSSKFGQVKTAKQDEKETKKARAADFTTLDETFYDKESSLHSPSSLPSVQLTKATDKAKALSEASELVATAQTTKTVKRLPATSAANLLPTNNALVLSYTVSNLEGYRSIHTDSEHGGEKQMSYSYQHNLQHGFSSASNAPLAQQEKSCLSKENPISPLGPSSAVPTSQNPYTGPITRLVPLRPDQCFTHKLPTIASTSTVPQKAFIASSNPVPQLKITRENPKNSDTAKPTPVNLQSPANQMHSALVRPTILREACGHCSQCHQSTGNINTKQRERVREPKQIRKTNRAEATPIVVIHTPHHNRFLHKDSYNRIYNVEKTPQQPWKEEGKKEDDYFEEYENDKCDSERDEDLSEKDEADLDDDEDLENADEENYEAVTLDVRGLFVREALTAVKIFLQKQDKEYIKSGFLENYRFVYIITGWGKLSPQNIPKLKPAVEELLNSEPYNLDYSYVWTNDGEMEVDFIKRKQVAELKKRSEERMKQRKREQHMSN